MHLKNQTLKKKPVKLKLFASGLIIILIFSHHQLKSQTSNSDFVRIRLGFDYIEYSGIAFSPDKKTVAISTKESAPVMILDWESQKIIQKFEAGNWNSGSKINYSATGKYLLLQELEYKDFSLNKPRNIAYEIINAETGNTIKKFENVQDVLLSSEEKYAVSLDEENVQFWNLANNSIEKTIHVLGAANAIALSPDGKVLVVSEKISPEILKNRFAKDKKGAKIAGNTRQMVCIYNVETGSKLKTVSEFYDIIYKLKFTSEGEFIIVNQTPEISLQVSHEKISYINLIDVKSMEPLKKGFTSMSINQPAIHFSNNQKFFAINSKGNRFQEIHLYDSETGTLQKRFELGKHFFEKIDGEKLFSDSRPSFTFLPGDNSILIAMGNQLIIWNFENNPKNN